MDHTITFLGLRSNVINSKSWMMRDFPFQSSSKPMLHVCRPGWQQIRHLNSFYSPFLKFQRINHDNLLHTRSISSRADHAKLGLPENATKAEVKSAYFSLAKKLHPDNGGNAKEFNELTEAYKRLLSDAGDPSGYGSQSHYGGNGQDSGWREEMERRRRARTWMEQKIMEEEWARMRAQQKQWKNHQSGRFDHVMPLMFLIMGSMVAFQMLFFSITPSGCSQFAEGCCCAKCLEHERCEEKSCFFVQKSVQHILS